jgi:hypothetical protein
LVSGPRGTAIQASGQTHTTSNAFPYEGGEYSCTHRKQRKPIRAAANIV